MSLLMINAASSKLKGVLKIQKRFKLNPVVYYYLLKAIFSLKVCAPEVRALNPSIFGRHEIKHSSSKLESSS